MLQRRLRNQFFRQIIVKIMLADLLLGYAAYAPGTFVIKALVAVLAASLFRTFREKAGVTASVLIAGAAAECWMIAGYFGYESFILGYGPAAAAGMRMHLSTSASPTLRQY